MAKKKRKKQTLSRQVRTAVDTVSDSDELFEAIQNTKFDMADAFEDLIESEVFGGAMGDEQKINVRHVAQEAWENLTRIDIGQTQKGLMALAEAIRDNPDLANDDLAMGQIVDRGARAKNPGEAPQRPQGRKLKSKLLK